MRYDKLEGVNARAPSPWDKFLTSPSPHSDGLEIEMRRSDGIPRLVPEVEQGNVEYKLILMDPTPERLQRLVTQLNWRLMEGNGEAYYQLGVADSGELVGLTKSEMEATLETLENMAGELGASVIISREIEVRGRLSNLALDSVNGMSRTPISSSVNSNSTSGPENSATDTETSEAEGTDDQDTDATDSPGAAENATDGFDPNEIIVRSAPVPIMHSFLRRSRKNRHEGKDSKDKRRIDRDKTLMPQDVNIPRNIDDATASTEEANLHMLGSFEDTDPDMDPTLGVLEFANLQISNSRQTDSALALDTSVSDMSKNKKAKPTKGSKPLKSIKGLNLNNDDNTDTNDASDGQEPKSSKHAKGPTPFPKKTPEEIAKKMADKRAKRDKRREERKRALLPPVYDHGNIDFGTQDGAIGGIAYDTLIANEVDGTDDDNDNGDIHTFPNTDIVNFSLVDPIATLKPLEEDITIKIKTKTAVAANTLSRTGSPGILIVQENVENANEAGTGTGTGTATPAEPRLIVEALVVRKAGFGRGFVDLSQFDEELRHLPSFSLS